MGTVETVKNDKSDRYGYRIPALAGEITDNVDTVSAVAIIDPKTGVRFDGRVIANPMFDVDTAVETTIGSGFSFAGLDNIYEIENALVADNLYGEYEVRSGNGVSEGTGLLVTFPTRYRHRFNDVCGNLPVGANYSYPFTRAGHIQFIRNQYDNMENTVLPPTDNISGGSAPGASFLYAEVNAMMMAPNNEWDGFAKSGWFDIDLVETPAPAGAGTVCDYNGVPTIAFVYDWMSSNNAPAMGNVMNSMLTPASYSPELVNRGYENLYPVDNDMGQ
jgi:hypothetical protein